MALVDSVSPLGGGLKVVSEEYTGAVKATCGNNWESGLKTAAFARRSVVADYAEGRRRGTNTRNNLCSE